MTPDLKNDSSLGLTPIINGIVEDAQTLIKQQLSLFQSEIKEDLGRTKTAAVPLVVGGAVSLLAGIFLFHAVVRLLMFEFPSIPDYGAYAIVGGVLAIIGGTMVVIGMNLTNSIGMLSNKPANLMQENVQWKTKK